MKTRRWHNAIATVLFVVTCLVIVVTVALVWAHQTVLVGDRFVNTFASVTEDAVVVQTLSERLSDQIVGALDLESRMRALLPDRADGLAVPLTAALVARMESAIGVALSSASFQDTWRTILGGVHERLIELLRGDAQAAELNDGVLTIDLLTLSGNALEELRADSALPEGVEVPDVSADPDRAAALARLGTALGATLPPDFGQVEVANVNGLEAMAGAVRASDLVTAAALIASGALVLISVWFADRRARAAAALALTLAIASSLVMLLLAWLSTQAATAAAAPIAHPIAWAALARLAESLSNWYAAVAIASLLAAAAIVGWKTYLRRAATNEPDLPLPSVAGTGDSTPERSSAR